MDVRLDEEVSLGDGGFGNLSWGAWGVHRWEELDEEELDGDKEDEEEEEELGMEGNRGMDGGSGVKPWLLVQCRQIMTWNIKISIISTGKLLEFCFHVVYVI